MKVPADKHVSVAEFENMSQYKYLEIKVKKLWYLKTVTISVVIGALGMNKKGTEKHLEKVPGRLELIFIIWYMPNFSDGTTLLNIYTYLSSIGKILLTNDIPKAESFFC